VVHADILKTDLAALAGERRILVYGNLPYYITSPILHHLFRFADSIDQIHIVIQREVAFRLVARPGTRDYGYLSVLSQYFSRPVIALRIPPGAFRPPPQVGSALVSMKLPGNQLRLPSEEESGFFDFVKLCFAHKRKTLINNLRSVASPEDMRAFLADLRLPPEARAEALTIAHFMDLYRNIARTKIFTR
jgi:16S rRNA (adenine1518-N6/adenine1519-N6)-dimethyltransferase